MDVEGFLSRVATGPGYAGQIAYVHEEPARPARCAEPAYPLPEAVETMLAESGIPALYSHQAEALNYARAGRNLVVATGTASGKSLCYLLPLVERLASDPEATALLLFPTKALCQDQHRACREFLDRAGLARLTTGVYDGDTPADLRRRLRDRGSVICSNPDMLHAALLPQHSRWGRFLSRLTLLVVDEMHVYNGILGANVANLFRRFLRVCEHHGARPQVIGCSATIGNPGELAERLTGRPAALIEDDGSPRGRRLTVLWNPPIVRHTEWRSRRSANVEAHELMARLMAEGVPTITFSKAKMTAEMIARYVRETLQSTAPHLAGRIASYRGGYVAEERRDVERRLFQGELLGVSTTNALELGIDVGGLDASIIVGYPGTLASFKQQAGRAGRQGRDSLIVLVGLDTTINQYVMTHPDYLFGRPVERAVVDADNAFVVAGHLRCAVHEMPMPDPEVARFGPHASVALEVLAEQQKVAHIDGRWYHAAAEIPQHEVALRSYADANVIIEDVDTGLVLGELNQYDAPPILHPEAIYMHRGDTYRVLSLDQERNIARVKREEVDYYTFPLGGTDVHHIDHCLREKPFGAGRAFWGEVTAYFQTDFYQKIRFYTLDAISTHGVQLETMVLETMAVWVVPPEELMGELLRAGLDAQRGLRGIGYAMRMMLPLYITCDTASFSHSVGSANSPWNALFIYERHPHGLGFTEKAYDLLHEILPATLEMIRSCDCSEGCPCCVGKPLRQAATWNVERGEGSVPNKAASIAILEGLLGDGECLRLPDSGQLTDEPEALRERVRIMLRRRMERDREPKVFHPIEPVDPTEVPAAEPTGELSAPDVTKRQARRSAFEKELRKRMADRLPVDGLPPEAPRAQPPPGPEQPRAVVRPHDYARKIAGRTAPKPQQQEPSAPPPDAPARSDTGIGPIRAGDSLAARARRAKKQR